MVERRVHPGDMISRIFGFIEQRDGNVFRGHARAAKIAQSGVKGVPNFRGESVEEQSTWNSQAKLSRASPQSRRTGQVWLTTHTGVKNSCKSGDIIDGATQRARAIECRRKGNDAFTGDAAPAWLQSCNPAEGCGNAAGAAGVRADTAVAKAGGNGGSTNSTRATRTWSGAAASRSCGVDVGVSDGAR